jgi:hypothetical protein
VQHYPHLCFVFLARLRPEAADSAVNVMEAVEGAKKLRVGGELHAGAVEGVAAHRS